ncbi:uncharacterized protein G2W53_014393 [Senna tora]|uniref:Uncharacterized protein n=1 Tax=Senna tora TaxID=362788 RepID=A0A834WTF6_9FABA|nr:uncharacterized protein G2W53_014393 [Senna tora]
MVNTRGIARDFEPSYAFLILCPDQDFCYNLIGGITKADRICPLERKELVIRMTSSWTVAQQCWKNIGLIPSGPGALLPFIWKRAVSISNLLPKSLCPDVAKKNELDPLAADVVATWPQIGTVSFGVSRCFFGFALIRANDLNRSQTTASPCRPLVQVNQLSTVCKSTSPRRTIDSGEENLLVISKLYFKHASSIFVTCSTSGPGVLVACSSSVSPVRALSLLAFVSCLSSISSMATAFLFLLCGALSVKGLQKLPPAFPIAVEPIFVGCSCRRSDQNPSLFGSRTTRLEPFQLLEGCVDPQYLLTHEGEGSCWIGLKASKAGKTSPSSGHPVAIPNSPVENSTQFRVVGSLFPESLDLDYWGPLDGAFPVWLVFLLVPADDMQNRVESPSLAPGGNPQALSYPHFQLLSGLEGLCSHEHPSGPKGQNRSPPGRPVEPGPPLSHMRCHIGLVSTATGHLKRHPLVLWSGHSHVEEEVVCISYQDDPHQKGVRMGMRILTLKNQIFLGNVGAQSISLTSPSKEPIFPPLKGFGILEKSSLHRPWSFIENLLAIFIYFEVNDVVPSDSAYHSGRSSQAFFPEGSISLDKFRFQRDYWRMSRTRVKSWGALESDLDEISEDCVVYGLFLEFFSLYREIGVLGNPKCPIAY